VCGDTSLDVYCLNTGLKVKNLLTFKLPMRIKCFLVYNDNTQLVIGTNDNLRIKIVNVTTGELVKCLYKPNKRLENTPNHWAYSIECLKLA